MRAQVLTTLAILFLVVLFFKHVEWSSVFYPMKTIEFTPQNVGLAYEDIFFLAEDGTKLNGWFVPADNSKAVLLFCHGNAGNIGHRVEVIEMLNEIGLDVFIFDYRGYGRSRGRPSERGTYADATGAYNYLLARPDAKGKHIILYGESLGGSVAIDLASRVDAAALITEGTLTSSKDVAKDIYSFVPVWLFLSIKYDSLSKIGKVSMPKLIIHSKDDEIISFRHAQRLFDAATEPKELVQMHGGHNYAILLGEKKFKEAVSDFVNKYIRRR